MIKQKEIKTNKKLKMRIRHHLQCQCSSPLHTIILERDDEWNEKSLTFILFRYKSFWGRFKACLNYLFGQGTLDFDSYLLRPEDVPKFKEWLDDGQPV